MTKNDEPKSSRAWPAKVIVAFTVVAATAVVWYSVYTSNQKVLQHELRANRRQAAVAALSESAGRFQMLSDGGYEADKKAAIAARLI